MVSDYIMQTLYISSLFHEFLLNSNNPIDNVTLCSYPEFFAIKHPILIICRSLQISLCIYSLSSYSWVKFSLNMWFSFIYPWSFHFFATVQSLSRVRLFAAPWITAHQASLSITNSQSLLKLMSIESVMPTSHLILCHPLLLLPPIPPSIRVFSKESTLCMRWPKYWSFSFNISPSNEHPGLMDWLDLLAVQGTLKSLLQHHSSKASIIGTQLFSQSNSHIHTWPLEKP